VGEMRAGSRVHRYDHVLLRIVCDWLQEETTTS
jgi:hypothetical protein